MGKLNAFLRMAFVLTPAIALCILGVYFLHDKVPRIIGAERSEIGRAYRAEAEALMAEPARATFAGPRPKGWRQNGRLTRADGTSVPWGHVSRGDRECIWFGEGEIRACEVPAREPDVDPDWFYIGIPIVLALFFGLSVLGIVLYHRAASARERFLAATAHDLKTPLVGLRGLIGVDDAQARHVNERMIRLVMNLVEFQRLGGRPSAPHWARVNLRHCLNSAYAIFAGDFAEEESGPVDISGADGVFVRTDETLLTQIFWNLFGNALKYGAPYGSVSVGVSDRGNSLAVAFADRGLGLTAGQRRHVFDRYYRAHAASSGKGGFGIGLCVARNFARRLGGDLQVAPNEPRGTIFTLTLPKVCRLA